MRDYDLARWALQEPRSVRDVVEALDRFGHETVFVTDARGCLEATVSDGDVRRALLAGSSLDSPAAAAYNTDFLALQDGADPSFVVAAGTERRLGEYPVIDDQGVLLCVESRAVASRQPPRPNTVVVMAGGQGLRMRPLTESTPKPMLSVGGKPILTHIVERLRREGFSNIVLAVNYLGEQIEAHFQDGADFGVSIRYIREQAALGTAGALSLLEEPVVAPIAVMNGDLILEASLARMFDYHLEQNAEITVGAKVLETPIPYGVLSTDGLVVKSIEEKPTRRDLVNAGVYVMNSTVLKSLPVAQAADMPDLITQNLLNGKVVAFPMHESWADIGRPQDFILANESLVAE